jgi:deoxyadenosine/deoxycytidine kinase
MNYISSNSGSVFSKTKIIEIVGPAGAGKTTLYQALGCHTDRIRLENFPDVHKWADVPFYILNGIQLISSLICLPRSNSRQLTRREFAWMSILYGWSALLRKQSKESNKAIILDQGPIYLLAEMRLFGPEYLRQSSTDSLWQDFYQRWKTTLDMVVLLDAANDVLLERIRNRKQELIVKDQPVAVVYDYLNHYRAEYAFLLSTLAARNADLKILRFDAGLLRPEDILNRFLSELGC